MLRGWHIDIAGPCTDQNTPCESRFSGHPNLNRAHLTNGNAQGFSLQIAYIQHGHGQGAMGTIMLEKDSDAVLPVKFAFRPQMIVIPALPPIGALGAAVGMFRPCA